MGRKYACTCFLLCIAIAARTQSIDTLVNRYNKKVPQEKAYVHFDNSIYLPGETVWYKSYLVIGSEPSWLSRTFYIDWCDGNGNVIERTKAPVMGCTASGSFTIPANVRGNNLYAVAYTKWMLNFDSVFLFKKRLILAQENPAQAARPIQKPLLSFFPEGGDMVEGIPSYIAFKATDGSGMPVNVTGTIKSASGQTLGSFASWHNGMGKLQLTPKKEESYIAEWTTGDGNTFTTALPKAKPSGLVLSIANVSGNRIFSVERAAELEDRFSRISVVATMNQQVVFRAAASFAAKTKLVSTMPVRDFPSGILQFTVLDNNQQPVAERILFIKNPSTLIQPVIDHDTINTSHRGRNVFDITLPDTALTSLSLSIMDGAGFYDASDRIDTRLLLTSELKGYIHEPQQYFASASDTVSAQLDLVMLTNGWRRFKWEHVLQNTTPSLAYVADTNYISVSGQVAQGRKKQETISLMSAATDSTQRLFYLPLQPDGNFREDNLVLFDTGRLYTLTAGTGLRVSRPVKVNNAFLQLNPAKRWSLPADNTLQNASPAFISDLARQRQGSDFLSGTTLKGVTVRAKAKTRSEELNELYASPLYNAVDAYQLNVVDDPNAGSSLSVIHYLEGKVAGLRAYNIFSTSVKPDESTPVVTWRGEAVVFLLNEMPTDARMMLTLPMSQVAFVKLFRNSFFGYKTGAAGNVVAVYTKKGNDSQPDDLKGVEYTSIEGYTPVKEFYSPDYSMPSPVNVKDMRRTLLWQPNINTGGENRHLSISFYNNDFSSAFRVVLEGMAQDGRLIHLEKVFK